MPLFSNCVLCPISVLLKLSYVYKSPGDLSKNEDSDSVLGWHVRFRIANEFPEDASNAGLQPVLCIARS